MFFSVITPTFNSTKYIKKNITSLNKQPKIFEQIFIDNLSSDSTIKTIKKNVKYPFKIIKEKDLGIYYAMNKGINIARGKFLLFLNSDDWLPANILQLVRNEIKKNKGYDVYYGNSNFYENNILKFAQKSDISKILNKNSISHQATYYSNKIFSKFKYDTKYLIAADYDLSIKLYQNRYKFFYINKILSNNKLGGFSSNLYISSKEFMKIQNKYLGMLKSMYNFIKVYHYKTFLIFFSFFFK